MDDTNDKLHRFCLCGGSLRGRAAPAGIRNAVIAGWERMHQGPGHGPASVAQARNARRRAERAVTRKEV